MRMHTTCTTRVHSLLPVHSALPYLGRSNCDICVMRESLSEELRAEVRTRNLRRVVLLGVTFGTRGRFGYGVRVAFCSGSLLLVVHRLLHALTCHLPHVHARRAGGGSRASQNCFKNPSKHKSMHKRRRGSGVGCRGPCSRVLAFFTTLNS